MMRRAGGTASAEAETDGCYMGRRATICKEPSRPGVRVASPVRRSNPTPKGRCAIGRVPPIGYTGQGLNARRQREDDHGQGAEAVEPGSEETSEAGSREFEGSCAAALRR